MTAAKTEPKPEAVETKAEMPPSSTRPAKEATRRKFTSGARKRIKPSPKKPDIILKLVKRSKGSSMQDLEKATGWQAHSIRAALTGLRKKGATIERQKNTAGETTYKLMVEG
ncbi:DUF3489 domain-containing protein [Sneathiella sp. HT1-7]|uniref:DUF3489 domain-containing protein n=1 Tax=Sneathiella sp. HT1-7 TaxID=2887192 RepID=UPI001D142E8E|nr:DUF3489 domain-containing protein [Sneathiella sp. HT1-7]MCC3306733.1 DUF3489 domain-containing protein [Sneathiella sp. HT1-7]